MAQSNRYSHVFEPIKIGNMTVKNRIQFSPLVCSLSGTNGGVTREYLEFIKIQAGTGVGVVNIGATSIDYDTGTDYADIQNKKECGGNRQWQRRFLRNWEANTKGKVTI